MYNLWLWVEGLSPCPGSRLSLVDFSLHFLSTRGAAASNIHGDFPLDADSLPVRPDILKRLFDSSSHV